MIPTLGKKNKKELWAIKNLSLTVKPGEIMGIFGSNGAGKSTLLSIISGIYTHDKGTVSIRGKVVSVIGLMSGLKDRLTMHDNIYLGAMLYDLTKEEVKKQEASIISFAKLEPYKQVKLYKFSTGMIARLIFSIAIHCKPDILLLDEITSNLDKKFTQTVSAAVNKLTQHGGAAIVVSH